MILGIGLILSCSLLPAFGGGEEGMKRFSISTSAGIYSNIKLAELTPLAGTADVPDVKVYLEPSGPEMGLSLGYALNRKVEFHLAASATPSRVIDDVGIGFAGVPLGKFVVTDAVMWNLGARILYGFGSGRLSPYAAAGFGLALLSTKDIGSKARPTVELAAGVKYEISLRLRADIEFRDTIGFFRYFEDFGIAYIMIYSAEMHTVQHRLGARATLRYFF